VLVRQRAGEEIVHAGRKRFEERESLGPWFESKQAHQPTAVYSDLRMGP
jgi:hypothetical protein